MATDIVEIFENYAAEQDFFYTYGTRNVHNLVQVVDNDSPNKIYLLVESVKRNSEMSDTGLSRKYQTFTGRYVLAYHDDFSSNIYNENNSTIADSKYKNKIKPLISIFKAMEQQFAACDGYEILTHDNTDVYNLFNGNFTGLFCNYKIRVFEN